MKEIKMTFYLLVAALMLSMNSCCEKSTCSSEKKLRHVVLFGFNDHVSTEQVKEVEEAFSALPTKIDVIKGYEWGTDCSPEGLQKDHTHCFFLSFDSEKDRDSYLVHPAHKEFGALVQGKLKAVTVVDYWVK